MRVDKAQIPKGSLLENDFNFIDGYKANFEDKNNKIDIQTIGRLFFSSSPEWIDNLFTLRNKIVKLFGLKTTGNIVERERQLENFKCEPNEQIGLFKVFHKSDNEVVLG